MKYILQNDNLEVDGKQYLKGVGGYDGTNPDESTDVATYLPNLVNITYNELKTLRDNSQLVPGQQYRITNYVTTTVQENTRSAGHQFDIIVTADDVNVLNENARAIQHTNDENDYFHNSDLAAWELKYCLDNDTNKFAWATNGKGVIYYMKDEFYNECPYDFKNIQFARWELSNPVGYRNNLADDNLDSKFSSEEEDDLVDNWVEDDSVSETYGTLKEGFYALDDEDSVIFNFCYDDEIGYKYKIEYTISTNPTYCYTFGKDSDYSLTSSNYGNVIKEYKSRNKIILNNIVLLGNYCNSNTFGYNCYDNTFGNNCHANTFGNNCISNTFGNYCYSNTFGYDCFSNTFGDSCANNTFGDDCNSNTFGNYCHANTFGYSCISNTFGCECYYNTFGYSCISNTFGNYCYSNTFGNNCISNTFGDECYNNTFGNYCYSNTFGYDCYNNTFGDDCDSNTFKDYCGYNTFGNYCDSNTFGNYCGYNTFGNGCISNTFGNYCDSNTFGNYCGYNTFGNGCISNTFGDNCTYNTFGDYCINNTFGDHCFSNTFGNYCSSNTFGNYCDHNTFGASKTSPNSYYRYIIFDEGNKYINLNCTATLSTSKPFQNVKIELGTNNTDTYTTINVDGENSNEINVYNFNGYIYVDYKDIFNVTYDELKSLRDNSQLISGRQYRITDYVTTTVQVNTRSAGHQFDIIVTADDVNVLNENARAIQHKGDTYFNSSKLEAWELKYCLVNTNNFAWADNREPDSNDYSKCTIKYDLYDGNSDGGVFITPFKFSGFMYGDPINGENYNETLDSDLIYEWSYTQEPNGNYSITLYKSEPGYYDYEGVADYYDCFYYRGVVNVDGKEYDCWQKCDKALIGGTIDDQYNIPIDGPDGNKTTLYGLTERITEGVYTSGGKGVIYYMKDEFGNECPYDFKNIQFARWELSNPTCIDANGGNVSPDFIMTHSSSKLGLYGVSKNDNTFRVKHTQTEFQIIYNITTLPTYVYTFGVYQDYTINSRCNIKNNIIKNYKYVGSTSSVQPKPIQIQQLNNIVFLNNSPLTNVYCISNTFGNECYSNTFGNSCNFNTFGNDCNSNTFGNSCNSNTFGYNCFSNTFGYDCCCNTFEKSINTNTFGYNCNSNTFGDSCIFNTFGNDCDHNTFGKSCNSNTFGNGSNSNTFGNYCYSNTFVYYCYSNTFGNYCYSNTFGNSCYSNTFGNYCYSNTFGNYCYSNTFVNSCTFNTFGASNTSPKSYYRYVIFENGVSSINLNCTATLSSGSYFQNVRITMGCKNIQISASNKNQNFSTVYGLNQSGQQITTYGV
jgi:hypothetical protein